MMFGALVRGFMTEWGYGLFRKRFRLASLGDGDDGR